MAQVTGGSDFDEVWEECSNASLVLLREAADSFAKSGESALRPDVIVASLLSVLAMPRAANFYPGRRGTWPVRFLDGTAQPPPPQESFATLAPASQREKYPEVVAALTRVISSAAKGWALGNPEEPDPREILRELFGYLWSRRLIPRPPAKAYPRGV